MSYTFVKITTYYREFLRQYYEKNPGLAGQTYEQQHRHLMDQAYGWSDFYSAQLRTLGADAHEIVANADVLQNTWAAEKGIAGTPEEIVFAQLQHLKPEVVFFQDSIKFGAAFVRRVRNEIPSVKLCIGWCCTIYTEESIDNFRTFDLLCVCSEPFYERFTARGIKTMLLRHAFEPSLLPKIAEQKPAAGTEALFIGSFIPGKGFHDDRQMLVESILKAGIAMDVYAHIDSIGPVDLLFRRSAYAAYRTLRGIGLGKAAGAIPLINKAAAMSGWPRNFGDVGLLKKHARPPLYGLEMYSVLSSAAIGLNTHGEIAGAYAANVRLFEVTGVGSCLLTDEKKNMGALFAVDTEAVTYRSVEECIEKLRWLIAHPAERKAIAAAGQQRVLREHTFAHRALQLHETIERGLRATP